MFFKGVSIFYSSAFKNSYEQTSNDKIDFLYQCSNLNLNSISLVVKFEKYFEISMKFFPIFSVFFKYADSLISHKISQIKKQYINE